MRKISRLWIIAALALAVALGSGPAICQEPTELRVNLELKDTAVRNAIEALFKGTGLNHVIAPGVHGVIPNMTLRDVTFDQALRTLTRAAGLTYRLSDGVYQIDVRQQVTDMMPQPQVQQDVVLPPEPTDRKVEKIPLHFADAQDIAAMFGGGAIQSRTSALAFGGMGGMTGGMGGMTGGMGGMTGGMGGMTGGMMGGMGGMTGGFGGGYSGAGGYAGGRTGWR